MRPDQLMEIANEARCLAFCPYSRFHVGAALLASDGEVFQGCNIESSSFGLTMCAERVALFKALSEGAREFEAMALAGPLAELMPCGACRQLLWEFAPGLMLYVEDEEGNIESLSLASLLPRAFDDRSLRWEEE